VGCTALVALKAVSNGIGSARGSKPNS